MKCYRTEFKAVKAILLGFVLVLGTTASATTIEVDADGGATLEINNIATNAQRLAVGTDNGGNSLIITNTGSVTVIDTSIGSVDFGNNSVLVTGSNSYLQAQSALDIGTASGSEGNQLTVADNGWVFVGDLNTNLPAGSGISVGSTNGSAIFTIGSGSQVEAGSLLVGTQSNATGSVSLNGDDATLALTDNLWLGTVSSSNSINVTSGASLTIGNDLLIGSTNSTDNQLTIGNGGSVVVMGTTTINNPSNNVINVNNGGHLGLSQGLDLDDETDGYNIDSGASLELHGTVVADKMDYNLSVTITGAGTTWNTTNDNMYIGDTVNSNLLTVKDGASVTNGAGKKLYVGNDSDANELIITGTNSTFITQGESFIGSKGSYNVFTIENNAEAHMVGTVKVGNTTFASNNIINVSSNGQLTADNNIIVGVKGGSNQFNIQEGQVDVAGTFILGSGSANNRYNQTGGTNAVAGTFVIGETADATGKTGFVDNDSVETTGNLAIIGTNATLSIQQGLTVGLEGGGSILTIRDGGTVTVEGNTVIGESVGDNYIYLQRDSNTLFNVTDDLVVGKNEEGSNRFAVYGGTANIGGNLYLGATTNQHTVKNFIHVETTNAAINVANALYIGASNSVNTLEIVDGATVSAEDLYVGTYEGVSNNVVTVRGENALLYVTNALEIGSSTGTNNSVVVENGGILNVTQTKIDVSGTNNILNIADGGTLQTIDWVATNLDENIVFDAGSTLELGGSYLGTNRLDGSFELSLNGSLATNNALWDTQSDILYVGNVEDGNTLTAKNGGMIATATDLIVGRAAKTTGNELKSAGTGSLIDVGNNLTIGRNGSSDNTLTIEEGGQVDVGNSLIIGSSSGSNNGLISGLSNSVSTLTIGNKLTIGMGEDANGNVLTISSNATVTVNGIATIGSNADNNMLEITGTNAFVNALTNFVIGAGEASGNELIITEGTATVTGDLIIGYDIDSTENTNLVSGPNALLHVLSDLYVGKDGSENTLRIADGGVVEVLNAYVGFTTNSQFNTVSVSGTNSTLRISETLYAGYEGSGNVVEILDGAFLTASNAYIGYASSDNQMAVSGSNSVFSVLNDMFVGNVDTNIAFNNEFGVFEQAQASIGNNLSISNGVLTIDAGSQVTVDGNYSQDEFSTLALRVSTNYTTTNLSVVNTASFAKDTTVNLFDDATVVGTTNNVARALVAAGSLEIDGQAATQDLLNDDIAIGNDLLDFNLILSNNIIWLDNVSRLSLATASGLEPGSQLFKVADEIDFMADGSNDVAGIMRDFMDTELDSNGRNTAFHNYYGEKMSSTPAHNAINIGMQSVAEQLTKRSDNTRSRIGMASSGGPAGAGGPHLAEQSLQGWVAGYKTWADASADGGFDGYDGSIGGFLIGADLSVAEGILIGIAGGAGNATLDKDNGASTDTDTTFGSIYMSAGTKDWFADASLIYGGSSVDTVLGSTFDTTASYDAQNTAIYVGGGKEIAGNYLIITPQASLLGNYYKQDSYEEESSDAVARNVDSFDTLYLQSSIGCNVGFYTAMGDLTLKPEFRAFWVHEFNAKEEDVAFQLVDGTGIYKMQLQAPESDIIKLGAGLSAKIGEYLELRADLDTRRGSTYSDHTLLGSIHYRF